MMSFFVLLFACRNYGKGYIDTLQDENVIGDTAVLAEPESQPASEPEATPSPQIFRGPLSHPVGLLEDRPFVEPALPHDVVGCSLSFATTAWIRSP